jgi:hypothetical protein
MTIRSSIPNPNYWDPRQGVYLYEDFYSSSINGDNNLTAVAGNGGAGGIEGAQAVTNTIGVVSLRTGTSAINGFCILWTDDTFNWGGGPAIYESRVKVSALSDGTNTYLARVGFGDSYGSAIDFNDGIFFAYTDSVNSGNWTINTANNGSKTAANTSVAPVADTWTKLGLQINAAGTLVEFFIDNVSVGTIATNIPTAAGRGAGLNFQMGKSAGQTDRRLYIDYVTYRQYFTTQR